MTQQEKILELKKRVSQNSIYINRVPKKAKVRFVKLAEEDFANDYGMTLKWLMDFREGLLSNPNQILSEKIDILADEIQELKTAPKEKIIKSVSGKIIRKEVIK